jgi:hypothetical protein
MRQRKSEYAGKASGFYQHRKTGEVVQAVSINKQGNAYKVVYQHMVKVGRYWFSEGIDAMEQTEFNINFKRVRS